MNLHHFELFYYVNRHRGIASAARNMPYGIQGPAISKQIGDFEGELGQRLFQRQPFKLTPAGERVAAKATQLIEGLLTLVEELKHGTGARLRMTSSEWVLQHHVSTLITFLKRRDVQATFSLAPAGLGCMERWLADDVVDLAIGALSERLPYGVEATALLCVPLALVLPKGRAHAHIKSAEYFWRQSPIREPLVCPSPRGAVGRSFCEGLDRLGVRWPIFLESGATAPVIQFVADGHGIGVSPAFPDLVKHPGMRLLPLPGFSPIIIGAMWRKDAGRPEVALEVVRKIVQESWPELRCKHDFGPRTMDHGPRAESAPGDSANEAKAGAA